MTDQITDIHEALLLLKEARMKVEAARATRDALITPEINAATDNLKYAMAEETRYTEIVRNLGTVIYPQGSEKNPLPGISQVILKDHISYSEPDAIAYCQTDFKAAIEISINDGLFKEYIKSLIKSGTLAEKLPFVKYEQKPFTNIASDLSEVKVVTDEPETA